MRRMGRKGYEQHVCTAKWEWVKEQKERSVGLRIRRMLGQEGISKMDALGCRIQMHRRQRKRALMKFWGGCSFTQVMADIRLKYSRDEGRARRMEGCNERE